MVFDPDLAPGGYAYFFVLGGWGTLGLALLDGYGKLEAQFEKAVVRFQKIEPFKVFDNLYYVGPGYVSVWLLTTPEGNIVFDSAQEPKDARMQ